VETLWVILESDVSTVMKAPETLSKFAKKRMVKYGLTPLARAISNSRKL
jgi:hypothetical protein